MKINKLYIKGFGKLKDFTIDFDSGLNVVFGENEDGKTTVMSFIRCMFYGTGNKIKDLSKSLREKYRPWDDSVMAGRIYFEDENKSYCLEREFKKTDSTDKITLLNTDTGDILPLPENLGVKFFGVTAETFERSMFIGAIGSDTAKGDESGEIGAKLSSLSTTGDEDTSFNFVLSNLENAKKKFVAKGKNAGTYTKDTESLNSLKESLNIAKSNAEKYDSLCTEIAKLSEIQNEKEKKATEIKAILENQDSAERKEKLESYIELCTEYETKTKALKLKDGRNITGAFLNACDLGFKKVNVHKQKIEDIENEIKTVNSTLLLTNAANIEQTKSDFESIKLEIAECDNKIADLNKKDLEINARQTALDEQISALSKSKKTLNLPLIIIAMVLIAAGVVCFVAELNLYLSLGVAGIGAILAILSFILKPTNKSTVSKLEYERLNLITERNGLQVSLSNINAEKVAKSARFTVLENALASGELAEKQLAAKRELLEAENEKLKMSENELIEYFSNYQDVNSTDEIARKTDEIRLILEEIKPIKIKIDILSGDLKGITLEAAKSALVNLGDENGEANVDFDALKSEYDALINENKQLASDIAGKVAELKTGFKNYENPESITRKIAELKSTVKSEEEFLAALDIAASVLEESSAALRKNYGSTLNKKTLEIFSLLTDNKYESIEVTKGLDIRVEQSGVFGTREIEYLSGGAIDQAYFSLKLAVSSLINDGKIMPILLDDSFAQYDDKRMQKTLAFLKDYASSSQAIFFTCHNSVKTAATDLGIEVKLLKK